MSSRALTLLAAVLLAVAGLQQAAAQPSTSSVAMQVYADGTVAVSQTVTVPESDTSINLLLVSPLIANPVATDQNGSGLYFEITGANITVYTIGATRVDLSYETAALTSKQGTVWTLSFEAYYNTTVTLPQGSTLTSVSGTPSYIATANGSPVVTVPKGNWEIDYGVPIVIASSSTVSSGTSVGQTSVTTTQTATQSSTQSTSLGTYPVSSTSGSTASHSLSSSTSGTASSGSGTTSSSSSKASGTGGTTLYLAAAAVIVIGSAALYARRRRTTPDLRGSELRPDDIKVIEFISEKGGKVLEPEIRTRFALPKTSAWRQVKRLERMGYVKVTKIGSQNQIEVVKGRPGGEPN